METWRCCDTVFTWNFSLVIRLAIVLIRKLQLSQRSSLATDKLWTLHEHVAQAAILDIDTQRAGTVRAADMRDKRPRRMTFNPDARLACPSPISCLCLYSCKGMAVAASCFN